MLKLITQRAHDYLASVITPDTVDIALGTTTDRRNVVSKNCVVSASVTSPGHLFTDSAAPRTMHFDAPLIIGVDPAKTGSGIGVFLRGKYVWSTTVYPCKGITHVIQAMRDSPKKPQKAHMFLEWNDWAPKEYSNRKAIASMGRASGIIETIYTMHGLELTVHEIKPSEWRSALGLPCKGDSIKAAMMQRCGQMGIKVGSHNEAEGVLIAEYGSSHVRYTDKINAAKK
jgi:hypothetical protein